MRSLEDLLIMLANYPEIIPQVNIISLYFISNDDIALENINLTNEVLNKIKQNRDLIPKEKSTFIEFTVIMILMKHVKEIRTKIINNQLALSFSRKSANCEADLVVGKWKYEITGCGLDQLFIFAKNSWDQYFRNFLDRITVQDKTQDLYEASMKIYSGYFDKEIDKKFLKDYALKNFSLVVYHVQFFEGIQFNGVYTIFLYLKNNLIKLEKYLSGNNQIYFMTYISFGEIFLRKYNVIINIKIDKLPRDWEKYEKWRRRINESIYESMMLPTASPL